LGWAAGQLFFEEVEIGDTAAKGFVAEDDQCQSKKIEYKYHKILLNCPWL
jgi:hypothetical protein